MAAPSAAHKLKTPAEMERIREKQAVLDEKLLAERKSEPNVATPLAYFEIARYTSGGFRGLFVVSQMVTEDAKGRDLKKPIRKTLSDGVDIVVAMSSLETAIRRRVFR